MDLDEALRLREITFRDRSSRVRAYTASGVQVCLAGVGEKGTRNEFTFPACLDIRSILSSPHWIRKATPDELVESAVWWRYLNFQPMSIIYANGDPAWDNDPIGMHGDTVTVVAQAVQRTFVIIDCADLTEVCTPPTPPMGF
jgi:hypothetical protein